MTAKKKNKKQSTKKDDVLVEEKESESVMMNNDPEEFEGTEPWVKDIGDSNIINNGEFSFCIGIFVEANTDYYGLMEMFNEAAVDGNRWKIKVISKEHIKNVVQNSIRSNKYKPFKSLCKEIVRHAGYELNGKIPTRLLVYFVLYELRRFKHQYNRMMSQREEAEEARLHRFQEALQYEIFKCQTLNIDRHYKKSIKLTPEKSVSDETYGLRRLESELCTRLEDRDFKYVEDFPLHGFDIYIAITTVYDPELALDLIAGMGVPVHCIIKVGQDSDSDKRIKSDEGKYSSEHYKNNLQGIRDDYYQRKSNKRKPFNKEELDKEKAKEINNFWDGFNSQIQHPDKTVFYATTTVAVYTPFLRAVDFENENWPNQLKRLLYQEISYSLFNQTELNLLYKKYMSSMEVTNLDSSGKVHLKAMEVYNGILTNIPNESINVPIIFDSIVAQVSALFGEETGYEEIATQKQYSEKEYHLNRQSNLLTNLKELNLIHEVLTVKDKLNDLKPRTILYGDNVMCKTYHLGNSAKFITEKTFHILSSRYKKLFDNVNKTENFKNYRKHMRIFSDAIGIRDRKKLSELLMILGIIDRNPFGPKHILLDEAINPGEHQIIKGEESKEDLIKGDEEVKPMEDLIEEYKVESSKNEEAAKSKYKDDTSSKYLLEDILTKINNKDVNNNHILMQNLNSVEEMRPEVLVQALFNASFTHNSCENIYIPILDGFLFKFYNSPKNHYDTCVVQTPITLHDFIKYSLPDQKEWALQTLEEIKNTYEASEADTTIKDSRQSEATDLSSIESDPYSDETVDDYKADDEEQEEEEKYDKRESSHDLKKNLPFSENTTFADEYASTDTEHIKPTIYDISPGQRVQFYSRIIEAMFRHGTKIKIHFQHQLYHKKIMSLELLTSGHRLYYSTSLTTNEDPTKLLLHHRTGMKFLFQQKECKKYATSYAEPRRQEGASECDDKDDKFNRYSQRRDGNLKDLINEAEVLERCQVRASPNPFINRLSTYSLSASWPNGAFIECDTVPGSTTVYIKQKYLTKGPSCKLIEKEKYRLNLPNNNVIKFMNHRRFEILFPTGKNIVCLKYIYVKTKKYLTEEVTDTIYQKRTTKIKPLHYKIFHTNGQVVTIIDGKKVTEEQIDIRYRTDLIYDYKISEMSNGTTVICKNDCSQVVEFTDGTRFTSVLHISPDEVFCDWSLHEKIKWFRGFSDSGISNILGQDKDSQGFGTTQKINLENEGFIYITMSTFIEHPNFASTYKCHETDTTVIRFPMNTSIYFYSDGTYDVMFANGTNISIKKDRFVIDKFLNNSLFQHSVIMPHALKFNDIPNPPLLLFLTSDIYGNEMKIDTTHFIYYRYALSEKNRLSLKHLTDNVNFFFLRRDLSGMEIFPQSRLALAKEVTKQSKGSYVQEFFNTPFKDVILLTPTVTASEEWIIPYSTPIILKQNKPSTYGNSWIFPFNKKEQSYVNTPKTLLMRVVKTFICDDIHKKLEELIEQYKRRVDHRKRYPKCECYKCRPWEDTSNINETEIATLLYHNGNITIKEPDQSFINYIREYIVLHAAKVASLEINKAKAKLRYNRQKSGIIKKQVPPYFGSCFGISYLLTKEIRDKANRAIEEKEYLVVLDILLNKRINLITNSDIEDMSFLLKILRPDLWREGVSIENVLKAGKELEDSFNNMREVLLYHINANRINQTNPNIHE